MAIFLTVVLAIYILVNMYLWLKGRSALSGAGFSTSLYTAIFISLASTFVAGKFLENTWTNLLTDILNVTGGFWMGFMLYGFLAWLAVDILLLLQKPFHLLPAEGLPKLKLWIFTVITSGVVLLIIVGFINAISPRTKRYDLEIARELSSGEPIRIVAVSDIHLGSIIRKRSMRHLSEMISREKPDIVLFLGDLLDGSIGPVLRGDLLSYLDIPEPLYGIYAITGNHEFMSDLGKSLPYIESKGIRVLKDEVITLDNGVQIIGRIDRTALHTAGSRREPLAKLLALADSTAPVILLDHQPYDLSSLAGTPVDLQMSGHTHNGQMWPLNLITKKMFELSHGYKMFGKTHVIVSSGFGIWGPRMRLGTRPEILAVTLRRRSE
jgi:predicted MPP superfamily phosphohydrolase